LPLFAIQNIIDSIFTQQIPRAQTKPNV